MPWSQKQLVKIRYTLSQNWIYHIWAHANRLHIRYLRVSIATCESKSRAIRRFCELCFLHLQQGIESMQDNRSAQRLPYVMTVLWKSIEPSQLQFWSLFEHPLTLVNPTIR